MFLTPDQLPFFGGTYFPNVPRYGMPALSRAAAARARVLRRASRRHPRAGRRNSAQALARMQPRSTGETPALHARAARRAPCEFVRQAFDREYGGFSGAPKFPHPDSIELLLRRHASHGAMRKRSSSPPSRCAGWPRAASTTRLGGGFARYSVDAEWTIPHFEKMLYDNGWLLRLYADAWAVTRDPLVRARVRRDRGVGDARDAIARGRLLLLARRRLRGRRGQVLRVERGRGARAAHAGRSSRSPRPRTGSTGRPTSRITPGTWSLAHPVEDSQARRPSTAARAEALRGAREARAPRPRRQDPHLVERAHDRGHGAGGARVRPRRLARLGAPRPRFRARARSGMDGRMLATSKDGKAHLDAYLDDHAYLLAALLEMLQADFRVAGPRSGRDELGDVLMERFHDDARPAASSSPPTTTRRSSSGPSPGPTTRRPRATRVAALALHRLAFLTGETRYSEAAAGARSPSSGRSSSATRRASARLLAALEEQLDPAAHR